MNYLEKADLIMPEYGRNIQNMIQYAATIPDREERTRCARTIIDIMGNLFPYLRDIDDFKHKLWDHLYAMSGYKLDIDYPFEVQKANKLPKANKIEYHANKIVCKHYGRWIEKLIKTAIDYPEGEQRQTLLRLIANNMKKNYTAIHKDFDDDQKIFDDIFALSDGKIKIDSDNMHLATYSKNFGHKQGKNNQKNGKNHRSNN